MASSLVATAAKAAHSTAASLLAKSPIKPGDKLPLTVPVKAAGAPGAGITISSTGKTLIVGVFGAFTSSCSSQAPGYIEKYEEFKAKGVSDIYIVTVNDAFVVDAWEKSFASESPVKFIADDSGAFVSALGLIQDAQDLVGGPRSKRFVIIANGDTVESVIVEEDTSKVTQTAASHILTLL